jgi:glycosyltransferase involved in cell wall biosynthesis
MVTAIVAARDEQDTIGAVVRELRGLPEVDEVVVVDDGSIDRTAAEASSAGARVLAGARPVGKGAAIEAAVGRTDADVYVLVDADVGETATDAARLLGPVLAGDLDLAVGRLPALEGGGFGLVKNLAGGLIRWLTGFRAEEPLSGQRAITRRALRSCRPLGRGFGLETAMTIDAARLGYRIGEIPVAMRHRATGRSVAGFIHRARQGLHILQAVGPRAIRLR